MSVNIISITSLLIGFLPVIILIVIMKFWSLDALQAIYANIRMLVQLLLVGYILTFIFETDSPILVILVIIFMISMSAFIALRPLQAKGIKPFLIVLMSLGVSGIGVLLLVTQIILDLPRWFEPQYVIPLAGMVFANSMNTISLVGERFNAELKRGEDYLEDRNIAMGAAMIPQVNALLAVG